MLSFLIPTYNYDCTSLLTEIYKQCVALREQLADDFDFEILVADDASTDCKWRNCYEEFSKHEHCRFIALQENYGRARIRNFLARQARFEHLVFIDCDAEVCTPNFVRKYWMSRKQGDVVCGALLNPSKCPNGGELRFRYEKSAERLRSVSYRSKRPYAYFTTFNVMFRKQIFEKLTFDERCTEYGYEDALMGIMLEKEGYIVAHIDNPLIHNGIDKNAVYLSKVETSLRVLSRLGEPLQTRSALVQLQRKLERYHVLKAFCVFYKILKPFMCRNLLGRHPDMTVLKLYKLGYYATLV